MIARCHLERQPPSEPTGIVLIESHLAIYLDATFSRIQTVLLCKYFVAMYDFCIVHGGVAQVDATSQARPDHRPGGTCVSAKTVRTCYSISSAHRCRQ